jgi:hypothetical protein
MSETYLIERDKRKQPLRSIELVYSPDDGDWYAKEWNFVRRPCGSRLSLGAYRSREKLISALDRGTHRWEKWA